MRATNARSWFPSLTVGLTVVCLAPFAAAQVALDGTTGPAGPLAGPDYAITAELGRRAGGNLFHSFERFSLRTNESATFSGPDGIANVISRVTGGARSDIDGTLRLTIPGADLWFLNPAGVIFGPNARLDVQGSFHVSTADELRFADGTRFSARNAAASTFTVAPPEAFGFLEADPGPIEVKQSQLFVPQGQILSMIGGGIGISGRDNLSIVAAPNGQINLVSMELPGLVTITQDNIKNAFCRPTWTSRNFKCFSTYGFT